MNRRTSLRVVAILAFALLGSEPSAVAAPAAPPPSAPYDRARPADASSPAGRAVPAAGAAAAPSAAPASPVPTSPPPAPVSPEIAGALWGRTALRLSFATEIPSRTIFEVEVSHRFSSFAGLDLALDQANLGYDHSGFAADLTGRLYLFSEARGGLSFAAGPSWRTADEFGTVAFLRGEAAVEYRPRGGVSVLFAAGESTALNDSGRATCPKPGVLDCLLWNDQIKKGDPSLNLRLAFGVSF
jgi:hypothetical protein